MLAAVEKRNCSSNLNTRGTLILNSDDDTKEINAKYISFEDGVTFKNPISKEFTNRASSPNNLEVMSFDSCVYGSDLSSCSNNSSSEYQNGDSLNDSLNSVKFMRKKLTLDWVKEMSETNVIHFETLQNETDPINSTSESSDSFNSIPCALQNDSSIDDSIIFANNVNFETDDESKIDFSEAVTEEHFKGGSAFFTKGSLKNLQDDEFCDNDDIEIMFSHCSLSSAILTSWDDIMKDCSELSQGFVNEGFEDFFQSPISKALKSVNDKWNDSMEKVDEERRTPVKVSFASNLVTVHNYEKLIIEDDHYDSLALDQLRFRRRIDEIGALLSPILSSEHRTKIFQQQQF